ncbi:MAG: hypothetical protein EOO73_03130 [Myxococcales bacterium]|nr:MAG: hypothetical protein EOO73_03130 [Myxococcales bacterium]
MRAPSLRFFPLVLLGLTAALGASGCGDDETVAARGPDGAGGAPDAGGEGGEPASGASPSAGATGGAGEPATTAECGQLDVEALGNAAWDPRFTIAGVTGHDGITPTIHDFAIEPDGAVLAAGRFAYHEGKAVPPLLRLRAGQWQPARQTWTLEPPGDGFAALALSDEGALALATADSFGERDGEIWLDRDDEQQVIGAFNGQVRSMAWFGGKLYVAGELELGEVANLAVWDGESWSAPSGGAPDGPVLELLVAGDSLYVGGAFTTVGGVASANIAAFDGLTWTPLPLTEALAVYALTQSAEGELYAGGVLGELGAASGLVKRVGDAWQVVGGGLAQFQTRGVVSDLVAHDGVVDVAGCFSSAGGLAGADGAVQTVGLARWDGASWQSLNTGSAAASPWFQPGVCGDEGVSALWDMEFQRLAVADERLFVGGSFAGVEGVQTQSLAVREGDAWQAQGSGGLGLGGSLDRVVAGGPGCELFGLGAFTHLGGEPAPGRVARFDGRSWQLLEDELPQDAYCPAIDVSAAGELAVACTVFTEDGSASGVLLSVEGDRLVRRELDTELPPLHAIKFDDSGKLWLSGGDASGFVATVDGDAVSFMPVDFDGPVQFLDVRDGDDVLVAGTFSQVGGTAAAHIAHYVAGEWRALGKGLVGQPQAIGRDANTVYASTYNDGEGAYLLGAFDGKAWSELGGGKSGLAVEDFYSFNQISPVRGGLILVGSAELQNGSGRGALLWKDGKLQPVGGGGVHGITVSGVAVAQNALWIGGVIAEVSDGEETTSSVGIARLAW